MVAHSSISSDITHTHTHTLTLFDGQMDEYFRKLLLDCAMQWKLHMCQKRLGINYAAMVVRVRNVLVACF